MNVRSLWILVALIAAVFYSLKRMYHHLNYAVPHFIVVNINNPPYLSRSLYPGYTVQWRYVLLYGAVALAIAFVIIMVLQDIANKER